MDWGVRNSESLPKRKHNGCTLRNSEYFDNHEQIAVFVPCRDGGSEILNPYEIKNRLLFCSVKQWTGGSEILNLFQEMYDLFHIKLHNLMELENWMCCFLWTQLNTFFPPSN